MTDFSELKRLAEVAPEGPWFGPEYAPGTSYVFDVDLGTLLAYEGIDSEKDACLRYVAAANPAAVLALIAENERLAEDLGQTELRALKFIHQCIAHADLYRELRGERDQLKAENEALRSTLTYIRDTSDDWHVCEKAADALVDSGKIHRDQGNG